MLICNNCFTVNEDGTERCAHCNMKGHFTHQDDEGWAGDPLEAPKAIISCRNCGSDTPGDGEKCMECRFPLPRRAPGRSPGANGNTAQVLTFKATPYVKEKS